MRRAWAITDKGYSQARACGLVGLAPRIYRYVSTRPDDVALRRRLKELALERKRFGYRRLHLLLKAIYVFLRRACGWRRRFGR